MTFEEIKTKYQEKINQVINQIYKRVKKYNVSIEQVENMCLFSIWKMSDHLNIGKITEKDINPEMFCYCYNYTRQLLQKERVIDKQSKPNKLFFCIDIYKEYNLNNNTNIFEDVSNHEIIDLALKIVNKYEQKYVKSFFYDGLSIINIAKKYLVHEKTVSYHLRNFIKKIRKQLRINVKEIPLRFNGLERNK